MATPCLPRLRPSKVDLLCPAGQTADQRSTSSMVETRVVNFTNLSKTNNLKAKQTDFGKKKAAGQDSTTEMKCKGNFICCILCARLKSRQEQQPPKALLSLCSKPTGLEHGRHHSLPLISVKRVSAPLKQCAAIPPAWEGGIVQICTNLTARLEPQGWDPVPLSWPTLTKLGQPCPILASHLQFDSPGDQTLPRRLRLQGRRRGVSKEICKLSTSRRHQTGRI